MAKKKTEQEVGVDGVAVEAAEIPETPQENKKAAKPVESDDSALEFFNYGTTSVTWLQ